MMDSATCMTSSRKNAPSLSCNVIDRAQKWVGMDPNPTTRRYVERLIDESLALSGGHEDKYKDDDNEYDQGGVGGGVSRNRSYLELESLFPSRGKCRIGFGTAGLRAEMKPGPMGMNDLVVIQTTQGLARYCQELTSTSSKRCDTKQGQVGKHGKDHKKLLAVVGFDHRSNPLLDLSSRSFALLAKLVFERAGMDCILLDCAGTDQTRGDNDNDNDNDNDDIGKRNHDDNDEQFVHTPLVAFATGRIPNAAVGCMITASHNPKLDNGYKVYWKDGCQIRPPMDSAIAECIEREDNLVPWANYAEMFENAKAAVRYVKSEESDKGASGKSDPCFGLSDWDVTERLTNEYFEAIRSSGIVVSGGGAAPTKTTTKTTATTTTTSRPQIVYTAMHGVGQYWAERCYREFGFSPFLSVPDQRKPNPAFPTVPFPNPEESGALDLAKAYAEDNGCDVVFANDPDADRLAVAERRTEVVKSRNSEKRGGGKVEAWTGFTGDQIGVMLGHWLWEKIGKRSNKPVAMCASTVSSAMLRAIAETEGFHFEDTLTGFKWIGSRLLELRSEGYLPLFGYEEAIGFACIGNCENNDDDDNALLLAPDKDGITAMAVMTDLARAVYGNSSTLAAHMQSLYDTYGEFVSNNGYYICHDPAIAKSIFRRIRTRGPHGSYIDTVGPYRIESIRDLGAPGYDSSTDDKRPTLPTSESSPMMTIRFVNGCVAQFRASGTEPKFKYYIEMRGRPGVGRDDVSEELMSMSGVVLETLLEPEANGLSKL